MGKIKNVDEPWDGVHSGNEVEAFLKEQLRKLDNMEIAEDNLYVKKSDGHFYPVSHPDLSTQPSILPQRFGTYRMYEVLIPGKINQYNITGFSTDYIPASATIVSVTAFDWTHQSAVNTTKHISDDRVYWTFNVLGEFIPNFFIVRYFDSEREMQYSDEEQYGGGQYGSGDGEAPGKLLVWKQLGEAGLYLFDSDGAIIIVKIADANHIVKTSIGNLPLCDFEADVVDGFERRVVAGDIVNGGNDVVITVDGIEYVMSYDSGSSAYLISPEPSIF